jgi:hypothetical protein
MGLDRLIGAVGDDDGVGVGRAGLAADFIGCFAAEQVEFVEKFERHGASIAELLF